ncbi:MAG: hypothetical protein LBQ38_01195 [Spirochaetaceae bacterium]|jgi:hypothetical protein|nr:hypothetical protein [Spirochaetaceae bacterium]
MTAILLLAASDMIDNKKQKIFPCLKFKSPEEGTQGVIEFIPPPEIRVGFYKGFIAQYHQPMDQKRQQVQNTIDLTGVVFAVSKIVFEVVSVVLQDIVVFVLCLPTGAGALRKQGNILLGYRFIGDPTFWRNPEPPTGGEALTVLLCAVSPFKHFYYSFYAIMIYLTFHLHNEYIPENFLLRFFYMLSHVIPV